jgi:hypothetical protein
MPDGNPESPAAKALENWRRAQEAVVAAIQDTADMQEALEYATAFEAAARGAALVAAELRDSKINEIWRTEELSIGRLAKRIGVSKSRAFQIVQRRKPS